MPLGKSFENILGDYFGNETVDLQSLQNNGVNSSIVTMVPIQNIEISRFQTRTNFDFEKIKSLASSIKEHGLIHPVVVLEKEFKSADSPEFTLLAGERRLRACKMLDFVTIPAIVKKEKELSIRQQALLTAMENMQREDLTPIEQANTFSMLLHTQNLNEDGLAAMLQSSVQYVKNYLRLLTLEKPVQQALQDRKIGEGQARHLVGLPPEQQIVMLELIIDKDLTVKDIIKILKQNTFINSKKKTPLVHNLPQEIVSKAERLAEFFPKAKLHYKGNADKGKITISWG